MPKTVIVDTKAYVPKDSIGFELGEKVSSDTDFSTDGYYALYGNRNVVSQGGDGTGFYSGNKVTGFTGDRNNLLKLEAAGNNSYRIHFLMSDEYIASPKGHAAVSTTYNANEAGIFKFKKSTRLENSYNIYKEGEAGDSVLYLNLQDWGYLGASALKSWEEDDSDGRSDWFIYKASFTANPDSVAMVAIINHALTVQPMEGNDPGYYADLSDYKSALATALNLRYHGGNSKEYNNAATALKQALEKLGDCHLPQPGEIYMFTNAYEAFEANQGIKKAMYAMDSTTLKWGNVYASDMDSTQYWWELEKSDSANCYYIKNIYTQTYMSHATSTGVAVELDQSAASIYKIQLIGKGEFVFYCINEGAKGNNIFLHPAGHNNGNGVSGNIVNWSYVPDNQTCWYINKINPSLVELTHCDAEHPASTQYYTLTGLRIDAPLKGINIVKTIYGDGTTRVRKILVK